MLTLIEKSKTQSFENLPKVFSYLVGKGSFTGLMVPEGTEDTYRSLLMMRWARPWSFYEIL